MSNKTEPIKARVTEEMKRQLAAIAEARGENESVILREAVHEYLLRHGAKKPLADAPRVQAPGLYSPTTAEIAAQRTNDSKTKPGPKLKSTRGGIKKTVEKSRG